GSAMQLNDSVRQRETDAQASGAASQRAIGLSKEIEDARQESLVDALAVVADAHLGVPLLTLAVPAPDLLAPNLNVPTTSVLATLGRVLDGVVENVDEHFLHASGVRTHPCGLFAGMKRHFVPSLVDERPKGLDRALHNQVQVLQLQVQAYSAGEDARDLQKVADELGEVADLSFDDLTRLLLNWILATAWGLGAQ